MRSPRGTKVRIRWIGQSFRIINLNEYHLHTLLDWQFNHRGQNMDLVKLSINCQLLNNHFRYEAHAWKDYLHDQKRKTPTHHHHYKT